MPHINPWPANMMLNNTHFVTIQHAGDSPIGGPPLRTEIICMLRAFIGCFPAYKLDKNHKYYFEIHVGTYEN